MVTGKLGIAPGAIEATLANTAKLKLALKEKSRQK